MLKIIGTEEETDNVIEMMALAGACNICPGAAECKAHKEEKPGDPWEELSCGEVIRHNVTIINIDGGKER